VDEGLITRDELSQTMLAILDISQNVYRIRLALEDDNGEDAEEEA